MRNGRKPLRDRDRAFEVASSVGRPDTEQPDLTTLTPPATDDSPSLQLALDSLDSLDEPAEVLIRVSSEALEGDSDLVDDGGNGGDDDDEIENLTGHERLGETAASDEADEADEADESAQADPSAAVDPAADMIEGDGEIAPDATADTMIYAMTVVLEDPEGVAPELAEPAVEVTDELPGPQVEGAAGEAGSEDFESGLTADSMDFARDEIETQAAEAREVGAEAAVRTAEPMASPAPYESAESLPLDDPMLQIRLARVHLKTGSLTIARAELEALAARNQLDTPAHLDLAEVRWRTGDLDGAGEAASAYIAGGGDEALGFVIAAEDAAMANRHEEARRYTEQALERHLAELDPIFAGIPRRAAWTLPAWSAAETPPPATATAAEPAEPTELAAPVELEPEAAPVEPAEPAEPTELAAPVEFEPEAEPAESAEPTELAAPVEVESAEPTELAAPVELEPEAAPVEPAESAAVPASDVAAGEQSSDEVHARAELAFGGLYLDADDPMMAALHFGLAIRLAPTSAKAVLEAIGDRQDLALQLVRGDALRLLGLEGDAGKAYQSVASALSTTSHAPPAPPPATPAEPEPPAAPANSESEPRAESPATSIVEEPTPLHWDD